MYPPSSRSFTIALRASRVVIPAYLPQSRTSGSSFEALPLRRSSSAKSLSALPVIWPSYVNVRTIGRLWRRPTSKSLGSCAGVILTTPVPFVISACSSQTIGISLLRSGSITWQPWRCLYLGSSAFIATAVSPSMVSGLVVASSSFSPVSFTV